MKNDSVTKMTADYIWANRDKGWVRNVALVQAAIPEVCRLWANAIRDQLSSLEHCDVELEDAKDSFEVTISKSNWGSRCLVFGCDRRWDLGGTWFAVYDTEDSTEQETRELLGTGTR